MSERSAKARGAYDVDTCPLCYKRLAPLPVSVRETPGHVDIWVHTACKERWDREEPGWEDRVQVSVDTYARERTA
jgi:hypothetical protein